MELVPKYYLCLSLALVVAVSLLLVRASPSTAAPTGGFSVELIHRDSQKSPYYNPAETPYQRLRKNLQRSVARADHLSSVAIQGSDPRAFVSPDTVWMYLMTITLGTPPFEITGIMDTGSNLIWTQCEPCEACFKQSSPFFDPSSSSTYRNVSCHSKECDLTKVGKCPAQGDVCSYSYTYGGGASFTYGNIGLDTITMGTTSTVPVSFPRMIIGCGYNNGGRSFKGRVSGIIGLGPNPISLVSQLGQAASGIFSYCLVPFMTMPRKSSVLSFGNSAVVSGPGTVSTPLGYNFLYYITLEGVTVGPNRVEFTNNTSSLSETQPGNIIIDSGTTLTFVPPDFYTSVELTVIELIKLDRMENPPYGGKLCYKTTTELDAPPITFHFKGGADVRLGPSNTFMRLASDVVCFALKPIGTPTGRAVYGSFMQMNHLVEYDLESMMLSFKPTDCTQS